MMVSCGTHKTAAYGDRESVIVEYAQDGVYIVQCRGRATKQDVLETARYAAMDAAKKRALHDVIFKILVCRNMDQKTLKPILLEVNAERKYETYFLDFFSKNGDWEKYVNRSGSRVKATHFSKTRDEMVVDMYVDVDRAALAQKLKDDGILK